MVATELKSRGRVADTPDKTDSGNEDDGWGDAADEAKLPDTEPSQEESSTSTEWNDPANLDERVAALRADQQQPPSNPVDPEIEESEIVDPENVAPADELATEPKPSDDDADAPHWAPEPIADEEPLPEPSSDLAAAVGIASKTATDEVAKKKRQKPASSGSSLTRKQTIKLVAGAAILVLTAVGAILGWLNSKNYELVCHTKSISAEQGKFWPWGRAPLSGPAFRAIAVPSEVICQTQSFDSRLQLEDAFLTALLAQSTKLLTSGGGEQVSVAEAQLEQALLLTRSPKRAKERALAERLQGDVSYWRGAAEVRRATEALSLGAERFEKAAGQRPRHSSDASAWAEHARFIAEEIDKGPRSLRADEAPKDTPRFGGLSEPRVEPRIENSSEPSSIPDVEDDVDVGAQMDAGTSSLDAALPRGGVLL